MCSSAVSYVLQILRPLPRGSALARSSRSILAQATLSYRPELNYMRGPGPKWREKHPSDALASTRVRRTEPSYSLKKEQVVLQIDPSLISPVAALLGALVGGGASLAGAIYTQRVQDRHQRVGAEVTKARSCLRRFRDQRFAVAVECPSCATTSRSAAKSSAWSVSSIA